jgi:long-chain fatty acid transport protein
MGGAVVASTADVTAMHVNPALLSFLSGTHFSFGTTVILPEQKFSGVAPGTAETKMQPQVIFPPNLYVSHTFDNGLAIGLGIFIPYAAKTEWSPDWVGNRLATKSDLRVLIIMPCVSMKVSDRIAFAAGINLTSLKLLYENRFPVVSVGPPGSSGDAYSTLDADSRINVGFQAGIMCAVSDAWTLGASYRSRIGIGITDGRVRFRDVPLQQPPIYEEGKFSTALAIPHQIHAGVGWQPAAWLFAATDVEYTLWSEFSTVELTYYNPSRPSVLVPEGWGNTLNARFGLEITIADVSLRGGIRFEKTPIPDRTLSPGLPDADGMGYSVGLGYRVGEGLILDFAYSMMQNTDRVVSGSSLSYDDSGSPFNGVYAARTHAVALNVRYSWK